MKLSAALDEIVMTYRVVVEAFTESVSLASVEGALSAGSQKLLAIAGGRLEVEVEKGRGHSEISNIYSGT